MGYIIRKITDRNIDQALSDKDSLEISGIIRDVLIKEYNFAPNQKGSVMADKCFSHFGKHYNKNVNSKGEIKRGYFVIIDEDADKIVGGGGYGEKRGEPINTFEIQRMFISKEYRGQGLGSQLLDVVLEDAFSQGYEQGYLDTRSDMKKAQDLYESRGFKHYTSDDKKPIHHMTADVMMYLNRKDWEVRNEERKSKVKTIK